VFLGCSSEAAKVDGLVEGIKRFLSPVAEVRLWSEAKDVFRPMTATLSALVDACRDFYDFGLFILHPDDEIESRGNKSHAPRDNVWFELGLFIGGLGERRTFALQMALGRKKVKVASDLDGINISRSRWKNGSDSQLALRDALSGVAEEIRHLGRNHGVFALSSEWNIDESDEFYMLLNPLLVHRHLTRLRGQRLLLVAKHNDGNDPWEDPNVDFGKPRLIDAHPPNRIRLSVALSKCVAPLKRRRGERIDAFLFVVPPRVDVARATTMGQLRDWGGLRLESKGVGLE
jgi:hypothetical protein